MRQKLLGDGDVFFILVILFLTVIILIGVLVG
jgi:hypothetical protein